MPKQNRVTPRGDLIAVPDRGTVMGNRGVLHDGAGHIKRSWQLRRWILCRLAFRGRRRVVMAPGRYTELFFLDEATALAAGHRPCFECLRAAFASFAAAWPNEGASARPPTAVEIDEQLHAERIGPNRAKRTFSAPVADLPNGAFVMWDGSPHLLWGGKLLTWAPGGYTASRAAPRTGAVEVLTPKSTVGAIRAGYVPGIHSSARALLGLITDGNDPFAGNVTNQ